MSEPGPNSATAAAHLEQQLPVKSGRPSRAPAARLAVRGTGRKMGELRRVHRPELEILSIARHTGDGPGHRKQTVSSAHAQISIAIVSPSRKWVCRSSGSAGAACSWVTVGEDGSLSRPMLIWRVREIGGANVVSTSHRESPRFFPDSGT